MTTPSGTYQLIYQPTLEIQDGAGNVASRGSILTWVKLDFAPVVINGTLKLSGTQGLDNMEVIVGPFAIRYTLNGFEQLHRARASNGSKFVLDGVEILYR